MAESTSSRGLVVPEGGEGVPRRRSPKGSTRCVSPADKSWATPSERSASPTGQDSRRSQRDTNTKLFGPINNLRKPEKAAKTQSLVASLYNENSCATSLALNKKFEYVTLTIICLNALWIGYDTDQNFSDSLLESAKDTPQFIIAENIFCTFFTFEVLVRFIAFRRKLDCRKDAWFVFDSILVTAMILETWVIPVMEAIHGSSGGGGMPNLSLLRMLRLARLTRMTRLMRAFPQMLMLVKGIASALRSVFFTLLLLSILMYIFAIIFTSTYKEAPNPEASGDECEAATDMKDLFGSMGSSLQTLFLSGTLLDDLSTVMTALREDSTPFLMIFVFFIVLSSFLVLNMMIGILFEVVSATTEGETYQMKINLVTEVLSRQFSVIDKDRSGKISEREFSAMCEDQEVMDTLESELDIEPQHLREMAPLLFSEEHGKELSFDDFLTLLVRHRPGEEAGPIDVQDFRKLIRMQEKVQFAKLESMRSSFQCLSRCVESMATRLEELESGAPRAGNDAAREGQRPAKVPEADCASFASVEQAAVASASDDRLLEELAKRLPNVDIAALVEV